MNNILTFLRSLIFYGKIPYFSTLKIGLLIIAFLPFIIIYFNPSQYKDMGEKSLLLLLILLALRPLSQIFFDVKILKSLMPLRKEIGILCGNLGIAHSIGFFLYKDIPLTTLFSNPILWDPSKLFFWGIIGFFIFILLTLTSNIFSITLLKRNWKKLHKLTYIALIVIVIHVVIIKAKEHETYADIEVLEPIIPVVLLSILWILSAKKIKIPLRKFFITEKE